MGCEEPSEGILFYFDGSLGEDLKIFTDYNLRRRGYTILDWCCMCQCSGGDDRPSYIQVFGELGE